MNTTDFYSTCFYTYSLFPRNASLENSWLPLNTQLKWPLFHEALPTYPPLPSLRALLPSQSTSPLSRAQQPEIICFPLSVSYKLDFLLVKTVLLQVHYGHTPVSLYSLVLCRDPRTLIRDVHVILSLELTIEAKWAYQGWHNRIPGFFLLPASVSCRHINSVRQSPTGHPHHGALIRLAQLL